LVQRPPSSNVDTHVTTLTSSIGLPLPRAHIRIGAITLFPAHAGSAFYWDVSVTGTSGQTLALLAPDFLHGGLGPLGRASGLTTRVRSLPLRFALRPTALAAGLDALGAARLCGPDAPRPKRHAEPSHTFELLAARLSTGIVRSSWGVCV